MHILKTLATSANRTFFILGLYVSSLLVITSVEAQVIQLDRLDRNYKVTRSDGTRIGQLKNKSCRNCSARETNEKSVYLKRVMTDHSSNAYQRAIELQIFADQKFVNGCWSKAIDKGMEFFFTVDETGSAVDFAWFPKERAGKCIKRHIADIAFPQQQKPHHSWLLVTGQEY